MQYKKVRAVFKGKDGSVNYEKDKEYDLIITTSDNFIKIEKLLGGGECTYGSFIKFLDNWDNIRIY